MNKFDLQVEKMVHKVHELLIQDKTIEPTHVLAAFVRETVGNPKPYVVSIGTGTNWIAHESLTKDGRTVFDSHAEIIARRSFKRYLYYELTKCTPGSEGSIFRTSDVTDGKVTLKEQYKIHLYISTAPCGCASYFSPHARHNTKATLTTRRERWSNFKSDRVQLALNRRLDCFHRSGYNLPAPFRVSSPRIRGRENPQIIDGNKTSLNWYSEMGLRVEITNGFLGSVFIEEAPSRLCKMELLIAFEETCTLGFSDWARLLEDNPSYLDLKERSSRYKEAKSALTKYFRNKGLGHWVSKPSEVDAFRLG